MTVADGMTLYGTLADRYKVSIAAGATVTLSNATILGVNNITNLFAGITCLGDATLVLEGANTVRGFNADYPGLYVPASSTLTIRGDGSLTAESNGYGAGIGGGASLPCGGRNHHRNRRNAGRRRDRRRQDRRHVRPDHHRGR